MKREPTFLRSKMERKRSSAADLNDGARVAVMGGGPAGSLFAYFMIEMAERAGLEIQVDIYEPRNFSLAGPRGCNMCAGILSESLIQMLAVDGINLPPTVVQRGMDTYILHTNLGRAHLETPQQEKRIGTIFRGSGPVGIRASQLASFDGFLLDQALEKGANLIRARIEGVTRVNGLPQVKPSGAEPRGYDFLAVATGVNTSALKMFSPVEPMYKPPETATAFIQEYFVGREKIEHHMGKHAIHFFLLDLPGLDFAAIVPKGDLVTVTLLGKNLNKEKASAFLNSQEVRSCMPPGWSPEEHACHCAPRINITGALHPYADRMIFLGDSGVARLYKDGIGAAYRAAKHAAAAVIFHGIGEEDLRRQYWFSQKGVEFDNKVGKLIFAIVRLLKSRPFIMQAVLKMVAGEQEQEASQRWMSSILWDMFTGSAPYRHIFLRFFHPAFLSRILWYAGSSLFVRRPQWKQAL